MVRFRHPARRAFMGGFGAASGLGRIGLPAPGETRLEAAGLFAGRVDDAGFLEAG